MKTLLTLAILFSTQTLFAQSVSDVVGAQLTTLQKKLGMGTPDQMALNIYRAKGRGDAFALQGAMRLFDKENKIFKELKKDAKELEDHLGQIDKWDSLRNKPKMDVEVKNLAVFIKTSNLSAKLSDYNTKIAALKISELQTKRIVFDGIKDEIDDIIEKSYDFTYGETGLHELRRNLRWPLIELDVFKGHYSTTTKTCRESDLYKAGRKSGFVALKENSKAVHNVDYCSYIEIVGAVNYLGEVKDKLEKQGVLDEKASPEIIAITEKTLADLKANALKNLL